MSQVSALTEIIRDEIRARGPLPFARFMELALYHPELGYYRKPQKPFGREGDFYTAAQLQPVFGEMIDSFASSIVGQEPILELGAGGKELRHALRNRSYTGFDWDQDELPQSFRGLIFANEFFDALPVHLLKKTTQGWRQLLVRNTPIGLAWEEGAASDEELEQYAEEYGASLPVGSFLEVSTEAGRWMEHAGRILAGDGYFLIIDYGYSTSELARFNQGTLLSYRKHQALHALLADPSFRDLTAHVNFTYLQACARKNGFELRHESSLASWAMNIWNENELTNRWGKADQRWRLQWKQIVFGLGESFRVLLLQKGTSKKNRPRKPGGESFS